MLNQNLFYSVKTYSKLKKCLWFSTLIKDSNFCATKPNNTKLFDLLRIKIEATGPMTVADYMKEVLISPLSGYYMKKDVFGRSGDFITSPEISQVFGEIIGVWFYHEWYKVGKPQPLQLVEFGPGRGTLTDDVLRVFTQLATTNVKLKVHFVEASPYLCKVQKSKLCPDREILEKDDLYNKTLETKYKVPLSWHRNLESVPEGFSLFLAHEFFDALPIHKFQKTDKGWREILIDVKDGELQYVMSRMETPASKLLISENEQRDHVEVSAESGVLLDSILKRMEEEGGISLIIDYGHEGTKTDTFRSFKDHKLHDPLKCPGEADITADVDFSFLAKQAHEKAVVYGPVNQANFLHNMGVEIRLKKLIENASNENVRTLKSGYEMLTRPDQMGERFKFLAMYPLVLKEFLCKHPPPGFVQ